MLRPLALSFVLATFAAAPAFAEPRLAPVPAASPAVEPSPATVASPEAAPATSAPSPAPESGASASPTDPAVTVRAMDWLRRLQRGDIDRTQLTIELNAKLDPARVKATEASFQSLGKIRSSTYLRTDVSHGLSGYQYQIEFAQAKYVYLFEVDQDDKVAGLFLSPVK